MGKVPGGIQVRMPDWLAGIIVSVIGGAALAWAIWVSSALTSHGKRLSSDEGWSRREHDAYAEAQTQRLNELVTEMNHQLASIQLHQANATLSPETKSWLDARFENLSTQVGHMAERQQEIRADIKKLEDRVNRYTNR